MLQVDNISFSYEPGYPVLKQMNFSLDEGAHLSVMGESGCGKTTLLKVIYGLKDLDQGVIHWKNNQILGPSHHLIPGMGFFKYVAQDFDLMPFTTVAENVSKFLSRLYPEENKKRTGELLEVIGMSDYANIKVKSLSGGQKQRVAIARALAKEPELLLLDEPFGQIDNFKKRSLRRMLFSYLRENNITCIVATHDAEDALSFADKMLVIRDHRIIASGHPKQLYGDPVNAYVANLFDEANEFSIHGESYLLYPHQLRIVEQSDLRGKVRRSYFKGTFWLIEVIIEDQVVFLHHDREVAPMRSVNLVIV